MIQYWPSTHSIDTWNSFCKRRPPAEGYARIKKANVLKMQLGDIIIFYIKGEKKFAGYAKITGEFYYDESPRYPGDIYPCRIPIEIEVELPQDKWIPIHPLLVRLNFAHAYPNKGGWGLLFRTEHHFDNHDGELIRKEIDNADKI